MMSTYITLSFLGLMMIVVLNVLVQSEWNQSEAVDNYRLSSIFARNKHFERGFTSTTGIKTRHKMKPSTFEQTAIDERMPSISKELLLGEKKSAKRRTRNRLKKRRLRNVCGSGTHLNESTGRIEWNGRTRVECTWTIDVTSLGDVGIVMRLDDVHLRRGSKADKDDTLVIFQGLEPLDGPELTRLQGSLDFPPLLVRGAQISLRLRAFRQTGEGDSRFSISYDTYPISSLPPERNNGLYDCSQPYQVPDALRCDMVKHCENTEDESYCQYWDPACRDGISHEGRCYKFESPEDALSPADAEKECKKLPTGLSTPFNVSPFQECFLAELLHSGDRRFVANLTSRHGLKEVIVGLRKVGSADSGMSWGYRHFYRFMWYWPRSRKLELEGPPLKYQREDKSCAVLVTTPAVHFRAVNCSSKIQAGYICEKPQLEKREPVKNNTKSVHLSPVSSCSEHFLRLNRYRFKICSDGSFSFLKCPSGLDRQSVPNHAQRFFACTPSSIHYSLTCDNKEDCKGSRDKDGTQDANTKSSSSAKDEQYCSEVDEYLPPEPTPDCSVLGNADEQDCQICSEGFSMFPGLGCLPSMYTDYGISPLVPNSTNEDDSISESGYDDYVREKSLSKPDSGDHLLELDGYGYFSLTPLDVDQQYCPETYFSCDKLCVPVYLIGNNVIDCPDQEDRYQLGTCKGYYRCQNDGKGPQICVHPKQVCDGFYQCPQKDDEKYCHCPDDCICEAFEYTCTQMFNVSSHHRLLRYLDLSHISELYLPEMNLPYIRFLNLSFCGLKHPMALGKMPLLNVLDLSFNDLHLNSILFVPPLQHLTHLNLSGNPLSLSMEADSFQGMIAKGHEVLESLSLHNTKLKEIQSKALDRFEKLRYLDIRGNEVKGLKGDSFSGLIGLENMKAPDQRLCCLYSKLFPKCKEICHAPVDELSSCSDLLRSPFLRVTVWILSLMALLGNLVVFVFRVWIESQMTSPGFRVLVTNLCAADLLMGIYMTIIGSADLRYEGKFIWEKYNWQESHQCRLAGFLALLSSEVSAFLICLITADRILVLRFPFKRHLHLKVRSAMLVCSFAWIVGLVLAGVPLLPFSQHWEFYSQTAICLPLPITRHQFSGQNYSFGIFIILNFVLFLFVGAGQIFIYITIKSASSVRKSDRRQQDMAIARRLFLIAFSDFCCWFPVGVMGLMAANGARIPGQVNAWTAVFILPLNSALNPFLYTLNVVLEKRQKQAAETRVENTLKKLDVDVMHWPRDKVMSVVKACERAMTRFPAEGGDPAEYRAEDRTEASTSYSDQNKATTSTEA